MSTSTANSMIENNTNSLLIPKTVWLFSSDFIITKDKIRTLFGCRNQMVLNMLFLCDYHTLPRIGISAFGLLEIHMAGMLSKDAVDGKVHWILTHIYSKEDPDWVQKSFKKNDVVQFILTLAGETNIEIEYQFKGKRSRKYRYPLPPLRPDGYLVAFTPHAHEKQIVSFINEIELVDWYLSNKDSADMLKGETFSESSITSKPQTSSDSSFECKICYNSNINRMFTPCGHLFCDGCCETMRKSGRRNCPVCNAKRVLVLNVRKISECLLCPLKKKSLCIMSAVATPCGCLFACYERAEETKPTHCPNCDREIKKIFQAFN